MDAAGRKKEGNEEEEAPEASAVSRAAFAEFRRISGTPPTAPQPLRLRVYDPGSTVLFCHAPAAVDDLCKKWYIALSYPFKEFQHLKDYEPSDCAAASTHAGTVLSTPGVYAESCKCFLSATTVGRLDYCSAAAAAPLL